MLFDQFWDDDTDLFSRADGDIGTYLTGRIGNLDVIFAVLPNMGTNCAAAAASLRSSYDELKLALILGICGGVSKIAGFDAFLGDVVVSKTIIEYDYGRQDPGGFDAKKTADDSLGRANRNIGGLLASLETELGRTTVNEGKEAPITFTGCHRPQAPPARRLRICRTGRT